MAGRGTATSYGKSHYTPTKQEHLRDVATMVLCAAYEVRQKNPWVAQWLLCVDLTAGPGVDEAGDEGSPLILLDTARAHAGPTHVWLFESDARRGVALQQAVTLYQGSDLFPLRVVQDDCRTAFPQHLDDLALMQPLGTTFGLLYVDPTTEVPWTVLAQAAERVPRVDILISLPATTIKRVCGVYGESEKHVRLETGKALIDKKVWLIRELWGRHQWTFLLGTNYPDMHECRRIGLVRLESARGQRIWERACLTQGERDERASEGQLRLF